MSIDSRGVTPRCRRSLLVVLVAAVSSVAGVGCLGGGDREEPTGSMSQEDPIPRTAISVIADPEEVARVRLEAEAREEEFKREALEELGGSSFIWIEHEFLSRYRLRPERITPELRQTAGSGRKVDPKTRAEASLLLCRLGDEGGWEAIQSLLAGDPSALKAGLGAVREMYWEDTLAEAVQEHLEDLAGPVVEALASPDPDVRNAAAVICGDRGIQEAVPELRELLRSERVKEKGRIIEALSKLAPDLELCRRAAKEVADGEPSPHRACSALYDMARHPDPEVASCAVQASAEHASSPSFSSSDCRSAIEVLAEFGSPSQRPLLRSLLGGATEYGRIVLLGGLARLGDTESRRQLIDMLGDPRTRGYAMTAILKAASESGDRDLVEPVFSSVSESGRRSYSVLSAILDTGGPEAEARVRALAPRLGREDRVRLLWRIEERTATAAAARLRELGLVDAAPSLEAAHRVASRWGKPDEQDVFARALELAGASLSFDVETDEIPCRHDLLILDLAATSGGVFEPEAVGEEWEPKGDDDFDTPYDVEFVFRDRLYRFQAQNYGDWYDLNAVLDGMNRALEDADLPQRYVPLHTGDQIATVLFGDAVALEKAAGEGWIVLSTDADASRRSGQAFEDEVLSQLGVQESSP